MSSSEPNMNDYVDFAAYLHNPWAYPSKKELAAMMIFKRKERFVENYSWQNDLLELIRHYFGNIDQLYQTGLKIAFENLKKKVIEAHLIGLILLGTTYESDKIINNYKTIDDKNIELSIKSICIFLIRDYIKKKNVENLCEKTPLFEKYINSV